MKYPFFLALDFEDAERVKQFIESNQLQGVPVKVGMELFYREGPPIIEWLKEQKHPIFLDLKLHDIPTTVEKAMNNIASLGVDIINVHAAGGSEMIRAAKRGLETAVNQNVPKLIAVTVLTSMDEATLQHELQVKESVEDAAIRLARLSKENGADGVVCSAHEARNIKSVCGEDFLTVTPGIRLQRSDQHDQKRVATPAFAKANQADFLVVGRSITQAENPKANYHRVIEEWNNA
ncbi:orotidine 5'-phosphate decarboxylase [Gracilibacillus halophilus YIM-C55.5]|uniref:Orotidine 5'-phosphate decarboxylase n=1 Tax=Gracilibacillus halophilus YIM-C55.5 TaxID=1308866 RepID=N4WGA4_9BACI|nr:orotidine-5'-phosphate decarboxylase [Gracilibacillus halophilus]ENH98299.1 orotidine 5'-phosphate decarboxylase [Gracilibacillus halophilus YIM-C55.5]